MEITAAMKISGHASALLRADGDDFITDEVASLALSFDGILDDYHSGPTRLSGGREPWYPRGTKMRNERQISIVSYPELAIIAKRLDIPEIKPEWIGANMVFAGIENLTRLPPRSLVFFEGGVTIKIDGDNGPCKFAGRSIASQFEGRDDIELGFAKHAKGLRGLVGWVEKPGTIKKGEGFEVRIPSQWIYQVEK